MRLMHLVSGTDVRGVAMGEQAELTAEAAARIAAAYGHWLSARQDKEAGEIRIGVGMDSRISGPALKEAIIQGLRGAGAAVFRLRDGVQPRRCL